MFVVGLNGSPRKNGNTDFLLSEFFKEIRKLGPDTSIIRTHKKNIKHCLGCGYCEKEGECIIKDDDMDKEIYSLMKANLIVLASPIYFYSFPSNLKALIDRSQMLWARKYRLKLKDPFSKSRIGFLLSLGATKGKNLFEGANLTAKYFFDAVSAQYLGSLTYKRIENLKDMAAHPSVYEDVKREALRILKPFMERETILFACRENSCRSQMAGAFASCMAGDRINILTAGSEPAEKIDPVMAETMREKGIDMAFLKPRSIKEAISFEKPNKIVFMGCKEQCPAVFKAKIYDWDIPDPKGLGLETMREVRDKIEGKVKKLLDIS